MNRISARVDEPHMERLNTIKEQQGLTTTEFVLRAIDNEFAALDPTPKQKIQALLDSDFIGSCEGPMDGSERYKEYVAEYLDEKYPNS